MSGAYNVTLNLESSAPPATNLVNPMHQL